MSSIIALLIQRQVSGLVADCDEEKPNTIALLEFNLCFYNGSKFELAKKIINNIILK